MSADLPNCPSDRGPGSLSLRYCLPILTTLPSLTPDHLSPSRLARVMTCPIDLVGLTSLSAADAVAATIPAAGSHLRCPSGAPPSDDEGDCAPPTHGQYAADASAGPDAYAEGGAVAAADADAAEAEAEAPGLGDLQLEVRRLQVRVAPFPPPRMLRLPAAAVHRRARSEGLARRSPPPSA